MQLCPVAIIFETMQKFMHDAGRPDPRFPCYRQWMQMGICLKTDYPGYPQILNDFPKVSLMIKVDFFGDPFPLFRQTRLSIPTFRDVCFWKGAGSRKTQEPPSARESAVEKMINIKYQLRGYLQTNPSKCK